MNKNELVSIVAMELDRSKKEVEDIFNKYVDVILETLATGEKVAISGFGTFEIRTRVERQGKDPRTGEDIIIPEQKSPAFRASKAMKEAALKSEGMDE